MPTPNPPQPAGLRAGGNPCPTGRAAGMGTRHVPAPMEHTGEAQSWRECRFGCYPLANLLCDPEQACPFSEP